ncbi:MAG: di-trans,poly-cis-decaprenylcistransferase [Dethiosulfovibrio peptidovorans]|nr:MAG: di-trans,poly-cis-decaprenylcistransferase [Dethiosulfovibrio peptidovorans]
MIDQEGVPGHLAVIMDGNGRWAKKRKLPRLLGHRAGVRTLETIVYAARDRGIKYLSIYAFSSENWRRPTLEVTGLMKLFGYYARKKLKDLLRENIRVRFAGNRDGLPAAVLEAMDTAESSTSACTGLQLIACFNYGGRREIVDAVNRFIQENPGQFVSEDILSQRMYLSDVPDPDLIVRTSGELRLSNFWLWQGSYSELYFTDTLWPDMTPRELDDILESFRRRERRYGTVR